MLSLYPCRLMRLVPTTRCITVLKNAIDRFERCSGTGFPADAPHHIISEQTPMVPAGSVKVSLSDADVVIKSADGLGLNGLLHCIQQKGERGRSTFCRLGITTQEPRCLKAVTNR